MMHRTLTIGQDSYARWSRPKYYPRKLWPSWVVWYTNGPDGKAVKLHGPDTWKACQEFITKRCEM